MIGGGDFCKAAAESVCNCDLRLRLRIAKHIPKRRQVRRTPPPAAPPAIAATGIELPCESELVEVVEVGLAEDVFDPLIFLNGCLDIIKMKWGRSLTLTLRKSSQCSDTAPAFPYV